MSEPQTMSFVPPSVATDQGLSDEDLARADVYGLLAEWFIQSPSDDLFNRIASSPAPDEQDSSELGQAWRALVAVVSKTQPSDAAEEFQALFVAVGKPMVALNASVYVGGALNHQLLVNVRNDLAELGIEGNPETGETEDHISTLCEVMRYLIAAPDAKASTLPLQQQFFARYLQPWVDRLFDAIEAGEHVGIYAAVAVLGRAFFSVERQAFDIFSASRDAVQEA